MEFQFNQLSKDIYNSVKSLGYEKPTEIQAKAIPLLLNKDTDFVGQAQTGTGKTAAFCLPLLEKIDFSRSGVQAIVLSPTRELANQINEELIKFGQNTSLKTATVYGGVGYKEQIANVRSAHVIVATPGRAIDLLSRRSLNLSACDYFIIDEADEMLKMGFIDDVDTLLSHLPKSSKKWMFSATMPREIIQLMERKLNNPELVRIQKSTLSNQSVSQSYSVLQKRDFFQALKMILLTEEKFYGIVFCETREEAKRLAERLTAIGEKAASLHGELSQNQRDLAMAQFKARKINILVCTDVAARGVDVTDITHVINMGLPRTPDSYVHRIGRTGRAGKMGKAISFVCPNNTKGLHVIERLIKDKIEKFVMPDAESSKVNRINYELEQMSRLKDVLIDKGEDFKVDDSFGLYDDFLQELSKEDIIKLMFSYQLNKDLKQIEEAVSKVSTSQFAPKVSRRKKTRNYGPRKNRTNRVRR